MSPLQMMAKWPLAKCPLAKCPLAKCLLAKCPLAKCSDTSSNGWSVLRRRNDNVRSLVQCRVRLSGISIPLSHVSRNNKLAGAWPVFESSCCICRIVSLWRNDRQRSFMPNDGAIGCRCWRRTTWQAVYSKTSMRIFLLLQRRRICLRHQRSCRCRNYVSSLK